jgi:hypothetical protein
MKKPPAEARGGASTSPEGEMTRYIIMMMGRPHEQALPAREGKPLIITMSA